MQELQDEVHSMIDSREFQDVKSVWSSKLSYVPVQPGVVSRLVGMLSRDESKTWHTKLTWYVRGRFLKLSCTEGFDDIYANVLLAWTTSCLYSHRIRVQNRGEAYHERERGRIDEGQFTDAEIFRKVVNLESSILRRRNLSSKLYGWQPKTPDLGAALRQVPYVFHSLVFWKVRFKTWVCACSGSLSEAMLWIKEVEIVNALDDLTSSRSVHGHHFPNFEMLDMKIALGVKKVIQNSYFRKRVSLDEQRAQTHDRFLEGRHIAFMIYEYFRVTLAHDTALDHADLCTLALRTDGIQELDTSWNEIFLSMSKILTDDVLESLYNLRKTGLVNSNRVGVVRNGDSSEGFEGEENSRSKVQVT